MSMMQGKVAVKCMVEQYEILMPPIEVIPTTHDELKNCILYHIAKAMLMYDRAVRVDKFMDAFGIPESARQDEKIIGHIVEMISNMDNAMSTEKEES